MSFRTDKIRGAHPITPKKGISEKRLGKNSDRIVVIKLGHDVDFNKSKELASKIHDPSGKILSEFNTYIHDVKGDKELDDYEYRKLQTEFFTKQLWKLYQNSYDLDEDGLKKKVIEYNKIFKDIYGHPIIDEKYLHTGDKYDLIFAVRDGTKDVIDSLPYGNAFDKAIMEKRNWSINHSVNFHKRDRIARSIITENNELAKNIWNNLSKSDRYRFTSMHIGYSDSWVGSAAAEREWNGKTSDSMVMDSLEDIINDVIAHPERFSPEFKHKVKPLIDISREKIAKAVVK